MPQAFYSVGGASAGCVLTEGITLSEGEDSGFAECSVSLARALANQAVLYAFTDRLYRADDIESAYDAALDAIVGGLRCERASILLFDDKGVMRFVAARGLSDGYKAAVDGHSPWTPADCDPAPIFVRDINETNDSDALKSVIYAEGIRALAFIPLIVDGAVIGKFMAYHDAPHIFAEDEQTLAVTIARQLGFALERARSRNRFRWIFDRSGVGMVLVREDGQIVRANAAFAAITGRDSESLTGANPLDFTFEGDLEENLRFADRLRTTREPLTFEKRYRHANGKLVWARLTASYISAGEILAVVEDVTARKETEEDLRESEERYRAIVETSPECVKIVARDGALLHMNKSGLAMIGAPSLDAVAGKSVYALIAPEDRERFQQFNEAICGGERGSLEFDIVGLQGERRRMETHATPFRNPDGTIGQLALTRDVTERRKAESHRALLVNELNHRVKNTLATVQSIALQTLRYTERSDEARVLFEARLSALSRAHDLLTRESWAGASLRQAVELAVAPFRVQDERFSIHGPHVRLSPKQAVAIALALHELGTNAVKYGALSNASGQICIEWSVQEGTDESMIRLMWSETGGPPLREPAHFGFGMRLLRRSLAQDLGGATQVTFASDGLTATMNTPLERWTGDAPDAAEGK